MFKSLRTLWAGLQPPKTAGPPVQIRAIGPSDAPIAATARWDGDELDVGSDVDLPTSKRSFWRWLPIERRGVSVRLFEVPISDRDQCMITYRFRVKTDDLKSSVYPEMWCRIPGMGEFFSRGLHQKIRGSNDWSSLEIPFYLKKGQFPDLLKLNLVFEGPGAVRLKDVEILATPLEG